MNSQQSKKIRPSHIPPLPESAGQPVSKSRLNKQMLGSICEKERISGYALAEKLLGVMDIPNSKRTVTSRGSPKSSGRMQEFQSGYETCLKSTGEIAAASLGDTEKKGKDGDQKSARISKNEPLPSLRMLSIDKSSPPSDKDNDASIRDTLTSRFDQTREQKMSALLHSKSTKETSSHTVQRTNKQNVILEHVIVQNGQSLDTVVIKEPFKDRYSIFAIDFLSGQRYELHFSSEDISNLLEGDMIVTSICEKKVWISVLDKVALVPVEKFSKVMARSNTPVVSQDSDKGSGKQRYESEGFKSKANEESYLPDQSFALRNKALSKISGSKPSVSSNNNNSSNSGTVSNRRSSRRRQTIAVCTSPVDFSDYILTLQSLENSYEDNLTVCDGSSLGADDHDYNFDFDSFDGSDEDRHSVFTTSKKRSSRARAKLRDKNGTSQYYPQHCVDRDIADAYHGHGDSFDPIKKSSVEGNTADAALELPQLRRVPKPSTPTVPHPTMARRRSLPTKLIHEKLAAVQPLQPGRVNGSGSSRPQRGRLRQEEAMSRLASTPVRSPTPNTPRVKPSKVPTMPSITNPSANVENPRKMIDVGLLGLLGLAPPKTSVPSDKGRHHPMPPTDTAHDSVHQQARQRIPAKNSPRNRNSEQEKRCSVKKDISKVQTESLPGSRAPSKRIVDTMEHYSSTNVRSAVNSSAISTFSFSCLQAAAEYNYERDDYEVDLEIFSIDPGGKLPPLMTGPAPFSPCGNYGDGHHEEPSVTSRSVSRPHIDRGISAVTAGTDVVLDQIVSGFQSRDRSNSFSKGALKSSMLVPLVIEESAYHLHGGCSTGAMSASPVALDSDTATGTYSYSNEAFEEEVFEDYSCESPGTWGKYVDENVDGGESYDFDDDENNNVDNDNAQGGHANVTDVTTSAPAYPNPPSKESGMELGTVPLSGDRVHRYGDSNYNDCDESADTTLSLNLAAVRYIVRNLDEAVDYQKISTTR